ncbi:IS110 family transposase [Azohydromonas australica]|uniref:IS110 family transposase n=1 Tax=Azohydromonas australica TaxID=364039 RepID=UPI000405A666|nr:IS110 family transposase [Azohydromonas australica]
MSDITRGEIVRVGVDLAKHVLQVHAVDAQGRVVVNKALQREKFLPWCAQLPPGCLIAMEACGGSHHWARRLKSMGLDARIIAAHFVAPYRMQGKSGKNDANDAAAVCEAASRPSMRFVPVKSVDQQGMMMVHRLREGYKEERTGCISRIRGLLAEFGLVFPQSPEALRRALPDAMEDANSGLPTVARLALQQAQAHWRELEERIAWCDERIAAHVRSSEEAKAAMHLCGVGPIGASALIACVGDLAQFRSGAQFGAWLGLVPTQCSSGGKTNLGGITKRGDDYLRTLLIQGAKCALRSAHKRHDRISQWMVQLMMRTGWQKAAVALANKNARILWAVLTRGAKFDPNHVSVMPQRCAGLG